MAWSDNARARLIKVEVVFTNIFGKGTRFKHSARLVQRRDRTHTTDAPTYYDLAGRKVRLGD